MIKRRLVCQIAGYDPVDAAGQHRRFVRGLPVFERTWNVKAAASDVVPASQRAPAHWTVATQGPNWDAEAILQPMVWDDIVCGDLNKPMPRRLARYAMALFDFLRSGTVARYVMASWKYGGFFFFPVFYVLAFGAVGTALGLAAGRLFHLEGLAHAAATAAVAAAALFALLNWPGRRWRVVQALDDWIFAWDFLHGRRPDVEIRLERFAQQLVAAARSAAYDEIVVIGHSLGATLAVSVVARALERDHAFGLRGAPVTLLTVGSTIPKFTLHPDAVRVRLDIARVAASRQVEWAEFHARADPISFYMFCPIHGRVADDRLDRKPIIRLVRIRNMVELRTYRRIQFRFMRVHHQFVMANERRSAYDFYMMACGPAAIRQAVVTPGGPAALIAADGSRIDAASPGAAAAR